MGKFTLLFSGCLLAAASVAAGTPTPGYEQHSAKAALTNRRAEQKPANAIDPKSPLRVVPKAKMQKAKSAKAPADYGIITEARAGKTVCYNKTCEGYFPALYYIIPYSEDCGAADITFTDDNEVYFKDIFLNAQAGTYVKGSLSDGVISMDMGQCIEFYDDYGYGLQLAAFTLDEENYPVVDETIEKVTFTVTDDGTITLAPGTIIGLVYTDNGEWSGYADFSQSYTVFTEKPLSKPEGMATEKWALVTPNDYGHAIEVGFDGNDIYIGGLSEKIPAAWIKGSINGDEVTFEGRQYMGAALGSHQYLMIAEYGLDEYGEETTVLTDEPAIFKYDAEARTLTPADEKILLINGSLKDVYFLERYEEITMYYLGQFTPAMPKNPEYLSSAGYDPYDGYGVFEFTLPLVDTECKLLDAGSYVYNIYVDNELFTLYPDEYTGIADTYDELTNIPYNYTDSWDIEVDGSNHGLYYYMEGFETLGVQAIYTVDGITNKSALVNYNIETGETNEIDPAAISAITASKEVTGVEYYDLTGRKLDNPTTGLVIKRTTYSDGSVKSIKRVIRQK